MDVALTVADDAGFQGFALGDVNGDQNLDMAVASEDADGDAAVAVLLNNDDGTFQLPRVFVDPEDELLTPVAIQIADVGSPNLGPTDGNPDVIAADLDGIVVVLFGNGQGGFQFAGAGQRLDLETVLEGELVGIVVGQFDGQNGPDIAVLDSGSDEGAVFFYCNTGSSTFDGCPVSLLDTDGDTPIAIDSGDINGDGSLDIAVVNQGPTLESEGNLAVFLGSPNGSFEKATNRLPALGQTQATGLAVGRINSDGLDDVVVTFDQLFSGDSIVVFFGQSDGRLRDPLLGTTLTPQPSTVDIADFDGDGISDLVTPQIGEEGITFVLAGDGTGMFTAGASSQGTQTGEGIAVAIGNVDQDPRIDFVVLRAARDGLRVALNQGTGETETPGTPAGTDTPTPPPVPTPTPVRTVPLGPCEVDLPGSSQPVAMVAEDFDRDGVPDVAVVDEVGGQVHIVLSNRASLRTADDVCETKGEIASYPVVADPVAVATGHINKDGRPDLAVSGPTGVTILLSDGAEGGFRVLRTIPASGNPNQELGSVGLDPRSVAIADFDRDSNADIASANLGSDAITVLYGQGDAEVTFQQRVRSTPPGATPTPGASDPTLAVIDPTMLVAADLNGDSWVDLAVASEISGVLTPFLNTQLPDSFLRLAAGRAISSGVPTAMVAADITRGGGAELLIATRDPNGRGSFVIASVATNGNVEFTDPIATDARPSAIGAGDIGAQGGPRGIADVVVASSIGNSLNLFIGNSDGTFMPSLDPAMVGTTPMALVVADFDGDELADIAVANAGAGTLTFLRSSLPPPTATPTVSPSPTFTNTPGGPTPTGATPTGTPAPTSSPTATFKEGTFVLSDCSVVGPKRADPVGWLMLLPPALALVMRRARRKSRQCLPKRAFGTE